MTATASKYRSPWENRQERPSVALTTSAMVNTYPRGADMAKSICAADGCDRESEAKGLCHTHYTRARYHDRLAAAVPCVVEGCGRPQQTRGLCVAHYGREMRGHSDALGALRWTTKGDLSARFHERYVVAESGCWDWIGQVGPDGYGNIGDGRRKLRAHRVGYELLRGPIPPGLVLDHLCRNRRCVNPAHLDPVTNAENILRGTSPSADNARKETCSRGHEFTGTQKGGRNRLCVTCQREAQA